MEPLHAVFDSYKLDELDRSWINQVCESGFSNIENVPVNYLMFLQSADTMDLLKETCNVVKNWMLDNDGIRVNDRDEVSWETLIAMNLEVQALLSVLVYLIKRGQAFDSNQHSRQLCLRATSLYFVLLAIPGSNAFQAFQPNLYEIALKSLELSQVLVPRENSSKRPSANDFDDSANRDDDEAEPCNDLSRSEMVTLTNSLNAVMYDLVVMLKSASTSMEIRSLEMTIHFLVEMTKLATEPINFGRNGEATTSSLAYNAYVALEMICNQNYAPIRSIARIIGKYTLPQFLISSANLPAKQMTIIRESTLYFLKNLISTHGQEARSALSTMIQHTMIKCPDRLDGRQKQAAIIVKLLNLCWNDEVSMKLCLRDLVRLSHHSKISCRIFAQEIIDKFITELSSAKNNGGDNNQTSLSLDNMEKILLASALERCADCSSMVRGRAIAMLAEFTESIERPEVRRLFENQGNGVVGEATSLEKLEEAIDGQNIHSLLPDREEIIGILRSRVEDERALVRRSALQIFRNAVHVSPELLEIAVPIVRRHCRDSALTVRRYAIRVLTNLLETFPDTPRLCEDWVDSVMPRVFDSEAKVQEEVMSALEKLTIDKITSNNIEERTNLPWKILDSIATNKMGDHLSRACGFWIDENRINDKKIQVIKSNVGSCNNMGAWLLLASISDNKKLTNMQIYYSFYGRTLVEMANNDVYLASLALRVLKNSWSSFDGITLQRISEDLKNCLTNYRVKAALIRHCLEILLDVENHLEKETLGDAERNERGIGITRELARLSESTINRIVDSSEPETQNDLLFRAVCTLGHAAFLSWIRITKETRRILQRFLLEWKSLPDWITGKKELQGAAVTVLGQQALIDREIAVEMTPIFGCLLCKRNKSTKTRNNADSLQRNNEVTSQQDGGDTVQQNGGITDRENSPSIEQQNGDIADQQNAGTNREKDGVTYDEEGNSAVSRFEKNEVRNFENMADGPVVRINAAKALADICVRFTSLVEPYLADMCISMKDENPEVRQVILVIFIQLLVEDTIMIKEAFFFHILTMLTDDDKTIREMTIFLIKERLLAKNKNLITQQFLNGIYHFNDYQRRTSLVNRCRRIRDRNALSLAGDKNMEKRRIIYDFMLENLDPPGKLIIIVKITRHVLNPRSNGNLDVRRDNGISVIRDAIYIVSSEYLQPNSCSRQFIDDDNVEEPGNSPPAYSIIVEAMKKHRNDVFLPCLVELKKHCEIMKSKVAPDIAKYLCQIVADSSKEALTRLYNEYPKLEREMQLESRKYSKRPHENSVEEEGEEGERRKYFETPKKSNLEKRSALINDDHLPRIVLRRLSTLTYPGTSGYNGKTGENNVEHNRNVVGSKKFKISMDKNASRR